MKDYQKQRVDGILVNCSKAENVNTEDHLLNDLGMDSLDLVEAVMLIEQEFNIALDDETFLDHLTVGGVYGVIDYELSRV